MLRIPLDGALDRAGGARCAGGPRPGGRRRRPDRRRASASTPASWSSRVAADGRHGRAERRSPGSRCVPRRACAAPPPTEQVLVGAATADGVRGLVELTPLDPADGRSAALVVGSPAAERVGLPARRAGSVDREEALDRAGSPSPSTPTTRLCPVVITGPTGIGKSAVAETFLAGLDDSWSVVELFCDPRRSVTPLHPFRPVLPELFTAAAEPSARAVVAALRERWGTGQPGAPGRRRRRRRSLDPPAARRAARAPRQRAASLLTSRSPSTIELNDGGRRPASPSGRSTAPHRARCRGDRRRAAAPSRRAQPDRRPAGGVPLHIVALTARRAGFPGRRGERAELAVRLVDVGARSPRAGAVPRPAAVGARAVVRRGGPRSRDRRATTRRKCAPTWPRSSRPACCASTTGTTGSPTR